MKRTKHKKGGQSPEVPYRNKFQIENSHSENAGLPLPIDDSQRSQTPQPVHSREKLKLENSSESAETIYCAITSSD